MRGAAREQIVVAVCIATFKRPAGLRRLLDDVAKLEFEDFVPDTTVIVVDNDADSTEGLRVCETIGAYRWKLDAVVEPVRGISFARNRAMQRALALGADVLAFIDDDETPDLRWLDKLLRARDRFGAQVVTGPVLPRYEPGVPRWVVEGRFFERERLPSGTELEWARTGNMLLDVRFLEDSKLAFDETFARSGGEDTLLTLQLKQRGARLVWADDAIVSEDVPVARASSRYLLRRAFLGGLTWVRVERAVRPEWAVQARRAVISMTRILEGGLRIPLSVMRGRQEVLRALATSATGLGALWSLVRDPPPANKY